MRVLQRGRRKPDRGDGGRFHGGIDPNELHREECRFSLRGGEASTSCQQFRVSEEASAVQGTRKYAGRQIAKDCSDATIQEEAVEHNSIRLGLGDVRHLTSAINVEAEQPLT
jgi:hypothetical protein